MPLWWMVKSLCVTYFIWKNSHFINSYDNYKAVYYVLYDTWLIADKPVCVFETFKEYQGNIISYFKYFDDYNFEYILTGI